jgi:hypothetical protein
VTKALQLARPVVGAATGLYATEPFGVELDAAVYAFDAGTIDLRRIGFTQRAPWGSSAGPGGAYRRSGGGWWFWWLQQLVQMRHKGKDAQRQQGAQHGRGFAAHAGGHANGGGELALKNYRFDAVAARLSAPGAQSRIAAKAHTLCCELQGCRGTTSV